MDAKTRSRYQARAKIIKAMAHPSRLFIIDQLAEGERCVRELTDMIGADKSTVSKHLSVLKEAGIVEDDKRGLQVYYTLRVPCVTSLFGCIEAVVKSNYEAQRAAV
ncbi:MAG: winged helix-turn-helix domain-containing protein [Candidatus Hydrogenedentes bacterium]|nr:winged helix-turn-helix domain-containing protein [Candidatus Hydrogenedentota bacterium]